MTTKVTGSLIDAADLDLTGAVGDGTMVTADGSTFARDLSERFSDVVNVKDFGAVGDNATDDRAAIQSAIDFIEASGNRGLLYSPPGYIYRIDSVITIPTHGGNAGLVIKNASNVHIDFSTSQIAFNENNTTLGAIEKDALLAITAEDGSSYAYIKNLDLYGGNFTDATHRPKNVFRMNYAKMGYCKFENMTMIFAKEDVWVSDGFVIVMNKLRARFAGTNHAGFKMQTDAAFGGANTGYSITGCTVDYAGLYGFHFTGSNGHTYCHIDNCHADFIGLDSSRNTIPANLNTAAAYRIENCRVINITACGVEYCSRALSMSNARTATISGLYCLGVGHSDGVTQPDNYIDCTDYFEKVVIDSVQFNNVASNARHQLSIRSVSSFNTNSVVIPDGCIHSDQITVLAGNNTSNDLPLVITPRDLYEGHYRRGSGSSAIAGKPLGSPSVITHSLGTTLEETFTNVVGGGAATIGICDITGSGGIGVTLEIYSVRETGNLSCDKWIGSLGGILGAGNNIQQPIPLTAGSGVAPVINWDGTRLSIFCATIYTTYVVKATAFARSGNPQVTWLSPLTILSED